MNNLYLIIGNDLKLINFYLNDILKKIDYIDDNKITYEMNESNLNDLLDEASMISLFGDKKIIIGNNFDINRINNNEFDYLSRYVNNINENAYIILIASKIDARVKEYKLFKDKFKILDLNVIDNQKDLFSYIKNNIKDNGYSINDRDIEYLISRTSNDINNIDNELKKLYMYKLDSKEITSKDIEFLVLDNIDNVIYEFTNAFYEDNYSKIKKMFDKFMQDGVSIDYLLVSLNNSFRQSLIMKKLSNDGESISNIAKVIGKKDFFVKKSLERLYMYTESDLAGYINKLSIIDREFKSGKSNISMLELFLFNH